MTPPGQESRGEQAALDRLHARLSSSGVMASWDWDIPSGRIRGDAGFATLYSLNQEQAEQGIAAAEFFAIIHPQDQPRIRLGVGGLLRGADVFSKEFRVVLGGGRIRWVHARGRCTRDKVDRAERFIGTLVDITEQKRVEEKLRIAQSAGGIGTFEYVQGFATVSVSAHFCRLLGLQPAQELPLRTINRVLHPRDAPLIFPSSMPPVSDISQAEFRVRRPDTGEERWLMRRGETVEDTDTGELRFSGVIYDITEGKRVEEQLRRLNETLEERVAERTADRNRLWHLAADIMLMARFDGTITAVNPACVGAFGWPEEALVGRNLFDLVHPDDRASAQGEFAELEQTETLRRFENRQGTRDGTWHWISWSVTSSRDLIYAVGRDVTVEKAQAEALQLTEEQLRQSQKMEAVGQLTGGLAHDFNNLLTGITVSLELLKTRIGQGRAAEAGRYIGAAQSAASRAASLTHRLLAFARRQTLDAVPTDANTLVMGMHELIQRTVGPEIAVDIALDKDLWLTCCDPNQLENALLNLCINARDAMPSGGRLTIGTANFVADALHQKTFDFQATHYVVISVADIGTGMSPEVLTRAFDPFFTTKPIGQGTGLGLSMIYGFARQSAGQVRIDSQLGAGTSVRIFLPRYSGHVAVSAPSSASAVAYHSGQERTVLVVDDEVSVRMMVVEVLSELGYEVLEAADGAAALKILEPDGQIDLLISDVGLPGTHNGRQVADAARVRRADLPVLFITGYDQSAAVTGSSLESGMHVLPKPFGIADLVAKVGSIMARQ
ncbi:MAG: PAS domain-containing protein [Pseudomonadota bacterium]